jgi:predicted transcriptional regulator
MSRRPATVLTEVELEFMQIIWSAGEDLTPDQILKALGDKGRALSDGSVRKMLSILVRKGYLTRREWGKTYLYSSRVDEEPARKNMVLDLLDRAFGGAAAPMVAALFESGGVREGDMERIKELIAKHEREVDQ